MTGRSVLLVEDELLIRAILSDVLRDAGYQVTEASAGDEGVELLARQAFDILVTDVKMPGMVDGLQLAEYWKEQFPDRPVLAASAHVRAEDASAFDAIITKPFSDEELLRAVELLVNAQAPLPTAQLAS